MFSMNGLKKIFMMKNIILLTNLINHQEIN